MKYSLKHFPGAANAPDIGISVSIGRRANLLSIRYEMRGDLSDLSIPVAEDPPARKDGLWENTCLELFLAAPGSGRYWEFNFSPAGDWNVYRFDSYRKGRIEEPSFSSLPFEVRIERRSLALSAALDVRSIFPSGRAMEAAASAVVRTVTGDTSHWSLAHPGTRPDFHRRDGFLLSIPI